MAFKDVFFDDEKPVEKTKAAVFEKQLTKTLPNERITALQKSNDTLYAQYKLAYNLKLETHKNKIATINVTEAECEGELQMPLTQVPKKKYGWYCGPMEMYNTWSTKTICDDVCEGIGQHYAGSHRNGPLFGGPSCSMDYLNKVQKDCKKNRGGGMVGCGKGEVSFPLPETKPASAFPISSLLIAQGGGMYGTPGANKCCWTAEMACKCWRWGKQSLSHFEFGAK